MHVRRHDQSLVSCVFMCVCVRKRGALTYEEKGSDDAGDGYDLAIERTRWGIEE